MSTFESVGIIGLGRFGGLLFEVLQDIYGTRLSAWAPERQIPAGCELTQVASSRLVFLAVPPSALRKVLLDILPHLSRETLLVDCSSVKQYPKELITELLPHEQACILTHPLFGPGSYRANNNSLQGFHVSIEVLRASEEQSKALEQLFQNLGLGTTYISADDHDRITARSQFVSLCISRLVKEMAIGESALDTPSSKALLEFAKQVSVDEALLKDYLRYNPYAKHELERLEEYFTKLKHSLQE